MTAPRPIALLLILALGLSACTQAASDGPGVASIWTRVSDATIAPGDDVPAPTGEVVLTLTGAISTTNVGDELQLDMSTLEQLGMVEYAIDDDQALGRLATFRGVLLQDLLDVAGADPEATTLETTALNDYAVTIPMSDPAAIPVLLATSVDGERMPVEAYGPTRIIYPTAAVDLDPTVYNPRFIWQLATIDVS